MSDDQWPQYFISLSIAASGSLARADVTPALNDMV